MNDQPESDRPGRWQRLDEPTGRRRVSSWQAAVTETERLPPLTAESRRSCPHCGATQLTYRVNIPPRLVAIAGGHERWYWSECPCEEQRRQASEARRVAIEAERRQAEADRLLGDTGMGQVAGFTLDRFDPRRLRETAEIPHPYPLAARWVADITDRRCGDYHDPTAPPVALFFYCPGKGRGKTHLAAALAWEVRRRHSLTCFLHEEAFTSRLWACEFEEKERLLQLAGEQSWITVIDDLGRMQGGRGTQKAWYSIINRRWLARRWTIVTSNYTLPELEAQGTIDDATASRLHQMTRGEYLYFDGEDQRLVD